MNIQDINKIMQLHFRLILGCLAAVLCCTAAQAQKKNRREGLRGFWS